MRKFGSTRSPRNVETQSDAGTIVAFPPEGDSCAFVSNVHASEHSRGRFYCCLQGRHRVSQVTSVGAGWGERLSLVQAFPRSFPASIWSPQVLESRGTFLIPQAGASRTGKRIHASKAYMRHSGALAGRSGGFAPLLEMRLCGYGSATHISSRNSFSFWSRGSRWSSSG